MIIVEIIPSLYPINGAERLVMNLAKSFVSSGNEVKLISLYSNKDNDAVKDLQKCKNIELFFLDKKRGFDFRCASKLKKLIKEINPDVIHCHLDSLITIWLSKIYKKQSIFFTFHTLINKNVVGSRFKLKNIIYKHIFKKKMVSPIAISNLIKQSICNYYNLPDSFVDVVYNGVPVDSFNGDKSYKERKYDFVYIGRFIDIKNPTKIVSTFLRVKRDLPNIKMAMIGEGPLLEECKRQSIGEIEFTGFKNDITPYLSNSKCLILFSDYEGNPMVINEAIASRCFLIATRVGGIPDVVNDKNGHLIEKNEKACEELESEMKTFVNNIDSFDSITRKQYENNKKEVSIEKTMLNYIDLFSRNKK